MRTSLMDKSMILSGLVSIRFHSLLLVAVGGAWASDSREPPVNMNPICAETLRSLSELPPLNLASLDIKAAMEKIRVGLAPELGSDFTRVKEAEDAAAASNRSLQEAAAIFATMSGEFAERARKLMSSQPNSEDSKLLLHGFRMLLSRSMRAFEKFGSGAIGNEVAGVAGEEGNDSKAPDTVAKPGNESGENPTVEDRPRMGSEANTGADTKMPGGSSGISESSSDAPSESSGASGVPTGSQSGVPSRSNSVSSSPSQSQSSSGGLSKEGGKETSTESGARVGQAKEPQSEGITPATGSAPTSEPSAASGVPTGSQSGVPAESNLVSSSPSQSNSGGTSNVGLGAGKGPTTNSPLLFQRPQLPQTLQGGSLEPAQGSSRPIERSQPLPLAHTQQWNRRERIVPSNSNVGRGARVEIESTQLLRAHFSRLWETTLRHFQSSSELMRSLNAFRNLTSQMFERYPQHFFLFQYSMNASTFEERLRLLQTNYSSLEDLGLSIMCDRRDTPKTMVRILFLDRLFSEIALADSLTSEEELVVQKVRALLSARSSKSGAVSAQEIGEVFLAQLAGPLSRLVVRDQYKSAVEGEFRWEELVGDLQSGKLDDLLLYARALPFLDIFEKPILFPQKSIRFTGPTLPLSEHEPEIRIATDPENYPRFRRGDAPPEYDIVRLLSGDMLEEHFRDEVTVENPQTPNPRIVAGIIFDISGSTATDPEVATFRNALIQAYIDRAQIKPSENSPDHVIYTMAYNDRPLPPQRIGKFKDGLTAFKNMRARPIGGEGNTDTSAALIAMLRKIAEHEKTGGELRRANILLITDGIDDIRTTEILDAWQAISSSVEIIFNVISLNTSNPNLEGLVKRLRGKQSDHGKLAYQFIPLIELRRLIIVSEVREEIVKVTQGISAVSEEPKLTPFSELRESLGRLDSGLKRKSISSSSFYFQVEGHLSKTKSLTSANPEVDRAFDIFLDTVRLPPVENWSSDRRAEILTDYIDQIASRFEFETEAVWDSISLKHRAALLVWLREKL